MARPVRSADQSQTSWHHSTQDSSIAANATANSTLATDADPNAGVRRRPSGRTGDGCRADRSTNQARRAPAASSVPVTSAPLQSSVLTTPSASAAIPAVSRAAPGRSGRPASRRAVAPGSSRAPATRAAAPAGTLTRKIHRQSAWVRSPPATGPRAAASPPIAVQPRTAATRRSAGAAASSRPSEDGTSVAAPAACTTRAATSHHTPGAAAHAADASVNTATPRRKARLGPVRSASPPAGTSSAAKTTA